MAASLTLQPSSSQPISITVSIHDDVNLTDFQTLELQKLATEINNRLKIISERPYGEDSSSTSKVNPEEVFRVYFKGLLTDERVRGPDSTVISLTTVGIGVAVCDSKDERVFELRKPLELSKDDPVCAQSVEEQALIEALNAAIGLDLKRIVLYCDCNPLYQFVTGQHPPKQLKTANILDQVNLLRKSFIYCNFSLIDRNDVNIAFKLAKEAIESHISKVIPTQEQLDNCVICLDDKPIHQFLSIEGCTHRYCYSCVKQHVEVKLLNGMLPKCPHEGCGNDLRLESCEKFLNPKFTEMLRQQIKEESILVTEKVYCPYPKCSTLMSRTEVIGLPKLVYGFGARKCYKCHGIFCIICKVPWHNDMNCAEYKRQNPTQPVEESKIKSMAARKRQCIKCKHMIELAAGCYHMTCRCGYEFCYTCGAEWENNKATCNCPLWDEEIIVEDKLNDFKDEEACVGFKYHLNHQKHASEISQMLERPYGEGFSSSSSKSKVNLELFRGYFKGLLSEERVHGPSSTVMKVTMAGIGVAICNSKDELIFEMRKPLDLTQGDPICTQRVEGQALIEALNAATALDLNRVVFYCDYSPLYQFVSGRWPPKQQKTKNILDQVNILKKSFIDCGLSLIDRNDVNFAFKLAREAIESQICKVIPTQEQLESCVICLDDKSIHQFFSIEGCTHKYCYSCVTQHVEAKLLNGVLPKCPHEGCGSDFRLESCEKFLNPKFTELMRQWMIEESVIVSEKVYCPYPKCSTLMSRTEVIGLPKLVYGFGARKCYKCHGIFCIICKVPWHNDMNCAEYKRQNPTQPVEESKIKSMAARKRQCIKCKHMIELAAGCYHMTCRCGYEFCYACGAEWKNKKATCGCPLWEEENIVDTEEEDYENDEFNEFEDPLDESWYDKYW
ncbi:uncharacterized protein LOC143635923 [Bidens hawaiensis]|uniref:uncharacterized protein LOC143635923 n=1 Tax=Bidens hawaiensis TaxID=980011 RepID=UPI00404957B9